MRPLTDIPKLENVPVLVRAALNVPIVNNSVANDYRLRRALPTIRALTERGARVVLIGHIGEKGTETLSPVADALKKLLPNVSFFGESIGESARAAVRDLLPGHVLVLENLRRHGGEKANDPAFAKELAQLADVFVQDSFDTCHRAHASMLGVPLLLPSYAGLLLEEEVRELSQARTPTHPSIAIIGGAKFGTKEPVLRALLAAYDHVFVGGALANDFLAVRGNAVGGSLVSGVPEETLQQLASNPKLILPVDARALRTDERDDLAAYARSHIVPLAEGIAADEMILDQGPATDVILSEMVQRARTVLWNGPLGNYENGFMDGTRALARAIANTKTHSVVGGGDTVAAIEELGLLSRFSFVSTGGGAMLDFLAYGTLPGIDALESR